MQKARRNSRRSPRLRRLRRRRQRRAKAHLKRSLARSNSCKENSQGNSIRSPHTGCLVGLSRPGIFKRIHQLRDQVHTLRQYFYRRICDKSYPSIEGEVPKWDLMRLSVWLYPSRFTAPTKTERFILNSFHSTTTGLGSPAVFLPCPNNRTRKDYFSRPFGRLKSRISQLRFPVGLLDLLHG